MAGIVLLNINAQKEMSCCHIGRREPKHWLVFEVNEQIPSCPNRINLFMLMRTLLRNAKQSNGWRTIKLARTRWAEEDGDQRAAAFTYWLFP
jgi:hypothetical protein